ncbi:organoarsenical effux MFS transporter ArsJ [Biformimicrobium ophioploci]|uniref:Organoarsenical effux MFS transporter ArsJ n=1 Tax=Biformimicrobium ophioploci TaxID=3036711 RepID=A0ABQ6M2J2_9GAMM|nr:organoarsenical effux MFS transporter ArsJ [Microbulbifer sp. NKW57]GMG88560.1 organoarsenical effux MFS transporter ArsJ [Microbulbifer sp. NKW57]
MLAQLSPAIRQYLLVTGNYWAFTLTDGALRMLVVLYFHELGYKPLEIALLFIFYEFFGVVTNLVGGWLGARLGLNRTMNIGLALQVAALLMLAVPDTMLSIPWVMAAQALSGIAKDLNKMSAKSAIKFLVPENAQSKLYRWVALLTGSKNTLKGIGFFMGGALLALLGFRGAVITMASALALVWLFSVMFLRGDIGKAKSKPKFTHIFSTSRTVNILSAARFFLFGARDVWFVVALPVFLSSQLGWGHPRTSAFLAAWIIGYGIVQALAPRITGLRNDSTASDHGAARWAALLMCVPAGIALSFTYADDPAPYLLWGLALFGVLFAINSALHSYLIVRSAKADGASLDIGFYYMANAGGRLIGTLLSGWLYQSYGMAACLWVSAGFLLISAISVQRLRHA